MGETGIFRFPGNLDPRAQEFRPGNPYDFTHLTLFRPQIYYPYPSPYPSAEVQLMPFCDAGVGYHHFPPAYVSPAAVASNPPLPPSSSTPTRALLLSSVPADVSESTVRRELEAFGEVRAIEMERAREGIVTAHFYDLRHAQSAMAEIREQHMQQQSRLRKHYDAVLTHNSVYGMENLAAAPPLPPPARGLIAGRAVWAQFVIPTSGAVAPDLHNQGTIVIFNLDSDVSAASLKEIFEAFGPVKELRGTPSKRHQRFVEFYDVRDAAKALAEMNGKEIQGKHVIIEFSRPGGHGRKSFPATQIRNSRFPPPPLPSPPPPPPLPPPRPYLSQRQHSAKRSSRRKSLGNETQVEASMAELSIGSSRRSSKKGHNGHSSGSSKQCNRPWKARQKTLDSHYLINEDAIMVDSNCRDPRTTVMIKNIPNKYSQKLLLNMLDNHCIHCNEQIAGGGDGQPLSSYDFVYLPIDFNNKCNVGYGFVNMTSPEATLRLYKSFHLQPWEVFNSRKICQVTYARLQGLEALKEHFKCSRFACDIEEYLPVIFSPPRDGTQLTDPLPIVTTPSLSHQKQLLKPDETDGADGSDHHDIEDEDDDDEDDDQADCSTTTTAA